MPQPYVELEKVFRKMTLVSYSQGILGWDSNTYMPDGASEDRGEQLATLAQISHQLLVSDSTKSLVTEVLNNKEKLADWQKANFREMQRSVDYASCISEELAGADIKASNDCEMIWRKCRKNNDFESLLPSFKKVVEIAREIASIRASTFKVGKYEALLGAYDPGRKTSDIDKIFSQLENFLPAFIKEVAKKQGAPLKLEGHFPKEQQKELGLYVMGLLGFNFSKGRLDESVHPFCGGTPDDLRITTRYSEKDFTQSLYGIVHETGHALYQANLPADWRYQPVGEAIGMSSHESQSLFVEKQICKSKEFIEFLYPKLHQYFSLDKKEWSKENLEKYLLHVQPSFIRVDADEVTYPMHVILRYKLEKGIIEGDFKLEELPKIWNEHMQKYLGIVPDSDANGCMQDIHWYSGAIGYFPTYTLGALTAAQLMSKVKKDIASTPDLIRKGDFAPIIEWLKVNIHSKGSLYLADDLLKSATVEGLNPQYFIDHVIARYS